jgi:serine/threonine protein kinase
MLTVRKVHRYFVCDAVARGSFCTIFRGIRRCDDTACAIRLCSKRRISQSPHAASILFNEKVLFPLLKHDHIANVTEFVESSGQIFQAMDLCPGDLCGLRDTADIPRLADEVLSALEFLHSLDIAHLDVKPDNVLLTHDYHARLTDFGFARLAHDPIARALVGSPGYCAPEILSADHFDGKKADVFSFGILLYFMFTGALPSSIINYDNVPAAAADLIASCLRLSPADRPTIGAIRDHVLFSGLPDDDRPLRAEPVDLASPVSDVSRELLRTLADRMECSEDAIHEKLAEPRVNIEKVLYTLVERCRPPTINADVEEARGKSLPAPSLIRISPESLPPPTKASFVPAARCDVMSAITAHMMTNRFCVATKEGGGKEMVLTTQGDDICVDVDVLETQPTKSTVVLSGDQAAVKDIHRFLNARFGATFTG